ncbi:MAG: hypothetical protein OQK82_06870 [Candidatus Pacearchaeota archaeon]|nr:hypothetical protein [Candidatus Pacearchaeota archaeon]
MVGGDFFLESYNSFLAMLPLWTQNFISFFLLVLLIVIYSTMVWKFYQFVSKKNPLGLNLNKKYKPTEHSFGTRVLVGILYFVEYALILPILIFIIFSVFTLFLIILSSSDDVSQILIISATVIASIRVTSYYKEKLSQEIAKILPFMLLATAVLNPTTFAQIEYVEKIINHLANIPNFLGQIWSYLIFIIALEIVLMFFDTIFSLFGLNEIEKEGKEEN